MPPLNAIDAISPAWIRTRNLLLRKPLNWRLLLKIGLVATFAQIGGCNANFNVPSNLGGHPLGHTLPAAALVTIALAAAVLVIIVGLAFFYISSRLQFVLFDIVLRRDTSVAPIWRRFGPLTWRWIGLKVLFLLVAVLCSTPLLLPILIHFIKMVSKSGEPTNLGGFVGAILAFVAATFLFVIAYFAASTLLHDFGLPSIALENTTIVETFRRVWALLRAEPGSVLFFLLMRLLLASAATLAVYLVLAVATLILFIPLGLLAVLLFVSLHHAGPGGHLVMIAGWVVLGLILLAALFVAGVMLLGVAFTFLQAYALYFLAGRYPLLAGYLDPQGPAYVFTPPPPPIAPADDGPSFPMDPALA